MNRLHKGDNKYDDDDDDDGDDDDDNNNNNNLNKSAKLGNMENNGLKDTYTDLHVTVDFVVPMLDICRLHIAEVLYKALQGLVERSGCNECTVHGFHYVMMS